MQKKTPKVFFWKLCLFAVICYALNLILGSLLELPKKRYIEFRSFHTSLRWEEFYSLTQDSLDILFLGSSHSYVSFDPEIVQETVNHTSFNMGNPSQSIITSYFVLEEVLRFQQPKLVVLELWWNTFRDGSNFTNASYNYEAMRPGSPKRGLFWSLMPYEWLNFVFPIYRYRGNLQDLAKIVFFGESEEMFLNEEEFYAGKGFIKNIGEFDANEENPFTGFVFSPDLFGSRNLNYLKRIADLCRNEQIDLVGIVAPLPPSSFSRIENYEIVRSFYKQISETLSLQIFDYNIINETEGILSDKDFKDSNHLNFLGAEKFTAHVCKTILQRYLDEQTRNNHCSNDE